MKDLHIRAAIAAASAQRGKPIADLTVDDIRSALGVGLRVTTRDIEAVRQDMLVKAQQASLPKRKRGEA